MQIKVIKRDGRKSKFSESKIEKAIIKAVEGTSSNITVKDIAKATELAIEKIENLKTEFVSVETIQDIVISSLEQLGHNALAKAYSLYRIERTKTREQNSSIASQIHKIGVETDRDNANVGNNFSAKLLRIASEANKWQILLKILPKQLSKPHENGDYYIHDLDSYNLTINCLHVPAAKVLKNGINTGYGTINSPQSIEVAAQILCIVLQASQNDMFGGQSIANFDNVLVPFVEKTRKRIRKEYEAIGVEEKKLDELVEAKVRKSVDQAMQGVVFNLNTMHSRAGSQVPFSSINLGLPESADAAMICESFLKQYNKGLGNGEQPIFPNIIFRVKDGVNKRQKDPYYYLFDLACEVASMRMNPTFMNIDCDFNKEYYDKGVVPATMGCRTYIMSNVNGKPGVEGRGNNAPVTINLVKLAITAEKDIDKFFKSFDNMINLAMEQLLHRYETLKKLRVKDLPFVAGQKLMVGSEDLSLDDSINNIMLNGTWGIGFIGLAETLKLLTGYHHGESKQSQELGLKIIGHLRDKCDEFSQKLKLNVSCYATPAEGLSGKFTELDKRQFGNIKWITDKKYYTNSFHVPVDYQISIKDKLETEAPYHKLCNAGHISYIEFDSYPTKEEIKRVITFAYDNTNINYVGINFHIKYCADCSRGK